MLAESLIQNRVNYAGTVAAGGLSGNLIDESSHRRDTPSFRVSVPRYLIQYLIQFAVN